MKNLSVVLNVILVVAVAVLYFLFFRNHPAATSPTQRVSTRDTSTGKLSSRIGYFDMDSLESRFIYIKEVRDQLKAKEQDMTNEMNGIKKNYMERIQQLQAKAQTMSQQDGQNAQIEIEEMQRKAQQREGELSQAFQSEQFKMIQGINKKIEDFLKTFNQDGQYAFIFSHQPGDFMYYKDSLCDITNDIVAGLNASMKPAK